MIVLGIDPGLATMGYGVIETKNDKHRLIQFGVLTTPARTPTPSRLLKLFTDVNRLMDLYSPDDVAFEELFFAKNVTTGMQVSAARGAALIAVAKRTENLYEYTPLQIKQAVTGYGKADKHQVQMMVKIMLNMPQIARPDDAADALAVAITHANSARNKDMYKIK